FKRQGKTLVYTTHYMEEAERLCDRIIIIDHGKVIANGTLDEVRQLVPATNVLEDHIDNPGPNGWFADQRHLPARKDPATVNTIRPQSELQWRYQLAAGTWLSIVQYSKPTLRSRNLLSHSHRKDRAQPINVTAFIALVRRDLRLFFMDNRAVTMSFVAPIVI